MAVALISGAASRMRTLPPPTVWPRRVENVPRTTLRKVPNIDPSENSKFGTITRTRRGHIGSHRIGLLWWLESVIVQKSRNRAGSCDQKKAGEDLVQARPIIRDRRRTARCGERITRPTNAISGGRCRCGGWGLRSFGPGGPAQGRDLDAGAWGGVPAVRTTITVREQDREIDHLRAGHDRHRCGTHPAASPGRHHHAQWFAFRAVA